MANVTDSRGLTGGTAIQVTVNPAQASLYFIHADHLGTPRLVTNGTNAVVWRHLPTTEAFGNTPPEEDPNATGNRFEMPLAFPGQYRDKESNLSYNVFRDYNPATGRYVQSDPIGIRGGLNTYSYVGGNPVSRIDPFGLEGKSWAEMMQAPADWMPTQGGPFSQIPADYKPSSELPPEDSCRIRCGADLVNATLIGGAVLQGVEQGFERFASHRVASAVSRLVPIVEGVKAASNLNRLANCLKTCEQYNCKAQ